MRYKTSYLTRTVREADAAGLSYGQYVAMEYTKRTQRKPIIAILQESNEG